MNKTSQNQNKPRGVEWWMISNVAAGAATVSFLNLLVPPFIAQTTGSAARVGIVFAIMALTAVIGPIVGKFADRTNRHRVIYFASILVMAGAFLLLALNAAADRWAPLFAIILGAAWAAQGTIGPAFIVGGGLSQKVEAQQLTNFNLAYPLGQFIGAGVVVAAQLAGASTVWMFVIAAISVAAMAMASWPGLRKPEIRLRTAMVRVAKTSAKQTASKKSAAKVSIGKLLASSFGAFLLVVLISSIGNNGLTSQIANIMPNVYGFSAAQTSTLLGISGLLNIGVIVWAGWWLGKRGSLSVYTIGTVTRGAGALLMAIIGAMTSPVLIVAAFAMLITFQGTPIPRLAAPDLATKLSGGSASVANGLYFAASAIGGIFGSLLFGFGADWWGWNSLNWMAAVAGIGASIMLFLGLRKKSARFAK